MQASSQPFTPVPAVWQPAVLTFSTHFRYSDPIVHCGGEEWRLHRNIVCPRPELFFHYNPLPILKPYHNHSHIILAQPSLRPNRLASSSNSATVSAGLAIQAVVHAFRALKSFAPALRNWSPTCNVFEAGTPPRNLKAAPQVSSSDRFNDLEYMRAPLGTRFLFRRQKSRGSQSIVE